MQLYRSTFKLHSPCGTPWQADTVWGHLCWHLVRSEGEEFLTELFLAEYLAGRPPVLVSDGFPSGWLPRPRGSARPAALDRLEKSDRVRKLREEKDSMKASFLTLEEFERARRGEFVLPSSQPRTGSQVVARNQINRLTSTTGEGGQLFDFEEFILPEVDIYWRVSEDYRQIVEGFLHDLKLGGYGKRRSIGYGQVESFTFNSFEGFGETAEANGFVSLSNFVPAKSDPTDGYWQTTVKYGRLGEESATSDNPFKRPIIQLTAGSCFRDEPVKEWYGRLVGGVAADERVVQYGYAFPVACHFGPVGGSP